MAVGGRRKEHLVALAVAHSVEHAGVHAAVPQGGQVQMAERPTLADNVVYKPILVLLRPALHHIGGALVVVHIAHLLLVEVARGVFPDIKEAFRRATDEVGGLDLGFRDEA